MRPSAGQIQETHQPPKDLVRLLLFQLDTVLGLIESDEASDIFFVRYW